MQAGYQDSHKQQGLDCLLQAHLPEFISALSAGLSPVKKHKRALLSSPQPCAVMQGAAQQHSPTASGMSMPRSFSAVQLHDPGLGPQQQEGLQQQQQQQQQQHWHARTASTDGIDSCWTDSCSSTGSVSPTMDSAACPGGRFSAQLLRGSWRLHDPTAVGAVGAGEAAVPGDEPAVQRKRLPACPVVLWRPAPDMVATGAPVAEAVEEQHPAHSPAAGSAAAAAAAAPAALQASAGQQQQGDQEGAAPLSPAARSVRSSVARSSSIANLMQMLHGLLGSGGSKKLQVQLPAEDGGLDMQQFMGCHSPDATSRPLSRASSRAATAAASPAQGPGQASGAGRGRGGGSSRSSPAGSPRASGSFPDLRLFWGSYSQAGSKVPSRQANGVNVTARQQQQQQQQQDLRQGATAAAAAAPVAAAVVEATPLAASGDDGQAGGMRRALPSPSPSPSKRGSQLHGPSRLSLRTSVNDAGTAAAEGPLLRGSPATRDTDGGVEQPATDLMQQGRQQPTDSQQQQLEGEGDTLMQVQQQRQQVLEGQGGREATQEGPVHLTRQHQGGPPPADGGAVQLVNSQQVLLPGPKDQQQQDVQRQLFPPAPQAPLQPAPQRTSHQQQQQLQQQQGAANAGQTPAQGPMSAPRQQSMLWSLMHRRGASSPRLPAAAHASSPSSTTPATAGAAAAGGTASAAQPQPRHATGMCAVEEGASAQPSQAAQEHSSTAAAAATSAGEGTAAAAAAAAAAVAASGAAPAGSPPPLAGCSAAVGVMADSMQRIASCLEDYLCDRSPAASPTKDTHAGSRRTEAAATAAAAVAGPANEVTPVDSSSTLGHGSGRDQGQVTGSSGSSTGDAVPQLTPKKPAAGCLPDSHTAAAYGQGGWSPAAAAAKARMLAACSPEHPGIGKLAAGVVQREQDTSPALQQQSRSDQDGGRVVQGVSAGWVHPGDLRQGATAAGRPQPEQQQQGGAGSLQQQVAGGHEACCVSHLPRGLRLPPCVGTGVDPEQQRQPAASAPPPAPHSQHHPAQAAAPTQGDSNNQLASLFALACRAVGVDLLPASQEAAAPAVAAAALTAAMAAAATAYQQQQVLLPQLQQCWQQQRVGSAGPAGKSWQQQQQHQGDPTSRPLLWRPGGSVPAEPSPAQQRHSSTWPANGEQHAQQQWHQSTTGQQQQQQQPSGPGGSGKSGLQGWEDCAQPANRSIRQLSRQGAGCAGQPSPPGIKLIQPERASQLRLLRPLCQPHGRADNEVQPVAQPDHRLHPTHISHSQKQPVVSPQLQHHAGPGWQSSHHPSSPVQAAPLKLVRLPVQQQPAAPLRPRVISSSAGGPAAPWQHPTAGSMQGSRAEAVPEPVALEAGGPVPWQALGWPGVGAGTHSTAAGSAVSRVAGSSALGAGAAATRLLQGGAVPAAAQLLATSGSSGRQPWPSAEQAAINSSSPAFDGGDSREALLQAGPGLGLHWRPSDAAGLQALPQHVANAGTAAEVRPGQCRGPAHVVVIQAATLPAGQQGQQQRQQAPWQSQCEPSTHLGQPDSSAAAAQQQAEAAPGMQQLDQHPPKQPQPQQQHCQVSAPRSPVKSPRKHPAGRRRALLQRLKANRSKAAAAAVPAGGQQHPPDAAAQLVAQLQELMQGPVGAVTQGSTAPDAAKSSSAGGRLDLDAAAAMALLAPAASQAAVELQSQPGTQQEEGMGCQDASCLKEQAAGIACGPSQGQLDEQASLHSAAAQTSEMLEPATAAAAVADAAVQAANPATDAGAQPEEQQGALELAQLILDALDQSGGVIMPDTAADSSSGDGQGGGDSCGLLPNPYAGTAAPRFQQVVDLGGVLGCWQGQAAQPAAGCVAMESSSEAPCMPLSAQHQQDLQLMELQHQQQARQAMGRSSNSTPQHGCCFAACPQHMASPELGGSGHPRQRSITRRTGTSASGTRPSLGNSRQQQQQQAGCRPGSSRGSGAAVPTLPHPRRSGTRSARQSAASCGSDSSRRLSGTQPRAATQPVRTVSGRQQGVQGQATGSRQPVSPHTWANERTQQLDELWQQWNKQQARAAAAAGQPHPEQDAAQAPQQPLLDEGQRQELDAAYARATAARAAARAAAQHAAASRSQRLRAELMDLGRMLAEVDTLAAQMEVESTQAAAAVQQFEADLNKRQQHVRAAAAGGGSGVCVA